MKNPILDRPEFTSLGAGAVVTTIMGALATSFAIRGAWLALLLSALFSLPHLVDRKVRRRILRTAHFVAATLNVFAVAVGLNTAGAAATARIAAPGPAFAPQGEESAQAPAAAPGFFYDWFGSRHP